MEFNIVHMSCYQTTITCKRKGWAPANVQNVPVQSVETVNQRLMFVPVYHICFSYIVHCL